jgi:N-acyl-phosphatidylethanolamine-hydrolysing phospholipase D
MHTLASLASSTTFNRYRYTNGINHSSHENYSYKNKNLNSHHASTLLNQQNRSYIFFPATFKQAQHDLSLWLDGRRKKRTIFVKLLKDRYTNSKTHARMTRMRKRRPSKRAMAIKYSRWRSRLRTILKLKRVTLSEYTQDNWFDAQGYPLTSRDEAGRFVNPWSSESTNGVQTFNNFLQWRIPRLLFGTPESTPSSMECVANVDLTPNDPDAIRLTWIGHATCLLQLNGYQVLTDPQFSHRAAPIQLALPFNGVNRHVPLPCNIDDLPETIDVCLLTHDHYDHLDVNSCLALKDRIQKWVVPLGIKDWLIEKCNIEEDDIEELEWWQSTQVFGASVENAIDRPPLTVTCAPTQHWSSRTMWDRNQRLWCSFVVESDDKRIYFGGDTGLPASFPLFTQIGQRLGPFDLAALPIGAYSPRFFMSDSHCDPKEAVTIHEQLRSKKSVAIHWGTFRLADEGDDEPRELLEEAVAERMVDFTTLRLGESIEVKGSRKSL